jgi:hypothetical protein
MIWVVIIIVGLIALWCFAYDDTPCERIEMGYNCKGKHCECRKVQYEDD